MGCVHNPGRMELKHNSTHSEEEQVSGGEQEAWSVAAPFSLGFEEPTDQPGGTLQMGIWSGTWARGLAKRWLI